MHRGKIAAQHHAAREEEIRRIVDAARRKIAVGHEVAEAFAVAEPLLIEAGDGEDVGNVDLLHKSFGASRKLIEERDALRIDNRFRLVAIDCGSHPTHQIRLQVWIFTAQDRVDANKIPLHIKRFDVMRDSEQVRFRRQLVSRVSPVTAAKEAQLPAGDQRLDAVLDTLKIRSARLRPFRNRLRKLRSLCRIGLQGEGHIDPVERVKMVEVNNVILDVLRARDDVADQPSVVRNFDAESVLDRPHRGERVDCGADSANALRPDPGFARIAARAGSAQYRGTWCRSSRRR